MVVMCEIKIRVCEGIGEGHGLWVKGGSIYRPTRRHRVESRATHASVNLPEEAKVRSYCEDNILVWSHVTHPSPKATEIT
jgi:hypothetical protein